MLSISTSTSSSSTPPEKVAQFEYFIITRRWWRWSCLKPTKLPKMTLVAVVVVWQRRFFLLHKKWPNQTWVGENYKLLLWEQLLFYCHTIASTVHLTDCCWIRRWWLNKKRPTLFIIVMLPLVLPSSVAPAPPPCGTPHSPPSDPLAIPIIPQSNQSHRKILHRLLEGQQLQLCVRSQRVSALAVFFSPLSCVLCPHHSLVVSHSVPPADWESHPQILFTPARRSSLARHTATPRRWAENICFL